MRDVLISLANHGPEYMIRQGTESCSAIMHCIVLFFLTRNPQSYQAYVRYIKTIALRPQAVVLHPPPSSLPAYLPRATRKNRRPSFPFLHLNAPPFSTRLSHFDGVAYRKEGCCAEGPTYHGYSYMSISVIASRQHVPPKSASM